MLNDKSKKGLEKPQISSQITLKKRQHSNYSHSVTTGISERLPNIQTSNNTSTERNEAVNEIEAMNNFLREMQKEGNKRRDMLNSVFDKNFDGKIKTCINTRAEMEARAAAFETIIQSETLIKNKEITTKNSYDGAYGINSSQTGSTSDKFETSPEEQQQLILQHNIAPVPTHKVAYVISPNKVESEQIFIEQADNTGKKIKGFGETALTKVGHWSKSAFNFFRTKNANSGKDAILLHKNPEKTSHEENGRSRHRVRDMEVEGTAQKNSKKTHWTRKVKSRSHRETKCQKKPKKIFQKDAKQIRSKKVKSVLKMSSPTELGNTSNALKKHAAKLTEAKKRLKERNATFKKRKNLIRKRNR
ncbi:unnamed protein product [Wuchereria bancrofti]|uniref:Uncharacterized protein n=1 Tax=Wuchereria bancrofti TaxID=6293 RepID=A0A3P7FV85_WUCBA|nr:unnamed protein product [Wuchereria bancrofti]